MTFPERSQFPISSAKAHHLSKTLRPESFLFYGAKRIRSSSAYDFEIRFAEREEGGNLFPNSFLVQILF
jgi:hypothetical protein